MRFLMLIMTLMLYVFPHTASAVEAESPAVTVCADPDPPPWTYWQRDAKGQTGKVMLGASVDTIRAAFAMIGKKVIFNGDYPWKRCLLMVQTGVIDFAMDGYLDSERAKIFDYSIHYQTLTPQIFFRADAPIPIQHLADLKQYRGCGMIGASYAHYGLRAETLDLGAGYDALLRKLKGKRCDYFVEELEVISGYQILGIDYLADPHIAHLPLAEAQAPAKHLMTAKNSPSAQLIPALNEALAKLIKSGQVEQNWKKHGGKSPYRP